jgi:hypothetical protein
MRRPLGPALGYLLPTYGSAAHLIRNNDPRLIPSLSAEILLSPDEKSPCRQGDRRTSGKVSQAQPRRKMAGRISANDWWRVLQIYSTSSSSIAND